MHGAEIFWTPVLENAKRVKVNFFIFYFFMIHSRVHVKFDILCANLSKQRLQISVNKTYELISTVYFKWLQTMCLYKEFTSELDFCRTEVLYVSQWLADSGSVLVCMLYSVFKFSGESLGNLLIFLWSGGLEWTIVFLNVNQGVYINTSLAPFAAIKLRF